MNIIDFFTDCRKLYECMLQPVGQKYQLSKIELAILLFLSNNPDYDTAADIVEKRRLTKSHVSAAVRELSEKGYIDKYYKNDNHKSIHLKTTAAAVSVIEEGQQVQRLFFEYAFENLSDAEAEMFKNLNNKMIHNIIKRLEEYH